MIFLHGGGDSPNDRMETLGQFVKAATVNSVCNLALIVAEDSEAEALDSFVDYKNIFSSLTPAPVHIQPILVSATHPLSRAQLEESQPTGVFVCGGSTPLYHQSLCLDPSWLAYLREQKIPYGGTSAGASVAANKAILGGWQATRDDETREMLFQGASEGLDAITVRDGLGLVPFAVEAHASQLGTLTRLIHVVESGLAPEGWAIDENTLLQVDAGKIVVYGRGHAYRVWRETVQKVAITIHTPTHPD